MKGFRPDRDGTRQPSHAAALRAYTELRQRILDGRIPKGTVVSEIATSETIGVSRTPLREAFRELLNEGLLEGNGPRRQVVVRNLTVEDVAEIVQARRALEEIVARAAPKHTDEQVADALRLTHARMERAADHGDTTAFLDADDEFHATLSQAASLPTIEDFLSRLRALTRLEAIGQGLEQESLKQLQDLHARIIDLVVSPKARRRALTDELARCIDLCVGERQI